MRRSLIFFMPPYDQGSSSGPPQDVGPSSSWDVVSCGPPPSSPGQASHGGASAVCTRSGRLSPAPCHLRDPAALSPCSGNLKSRRPQPLRQHPKGVIMIQFRWHPPGSSASRWRRPAQPARVPLAPLLHWHVPPAPALGPWAAPLLTLSAAFLAPRPGRP